MQNFKKITIILFLTILTITLVGCSHKHVYGEWITTIEATCLNSGQRKKVCECGDVVYEKITNDTHKFGNWNIVKYPTCTSTGTKERVCSSCKEKESMTLAIDANAHSTTGGKCSYCGKNFGFENLKSYVLNNGEYSDGEYELTFYTEYKNGYYYKFYLRYNLSDNKIFIELFDYNSSNNSYLTSIAISDNSVYDWAIVCSNDNQMSGHLDPSSYNENSSLTYIYTNIKYSELKNAYLKLAKTGIDYILLMYKIKITNSSISLYNLGFRI